MSNVIDEFTIRFATQYGAVLDEHIRFVLKPRPKLIPEKLWIWLAARFLVIEKRPGNIFPVDEEKTA